MSGTTRHCQGDTSAAFTKRKNKKPAIILCLENLLDNPKKDAKVSQDLRKIWVLGKVLLNELGGDSKHVLQYRWEEWKRVEETLDQIF